MTDENKVPAQSGATQDDAEPSDAAKMLHGEAAQPERFDQPEAVTLPGDTRIAEPAEEEPRAKGSL